MNYTIENFINFCDDMMIVKEGFDEEFATRSRSMDEEFKNFDKQYAETLKCINDAHKRIAKDNDNFEIGWKISGLIMTLVTVAMAAFVAHFVKNFYFTKERAYIKEIQKDYMPKIKENNKKAKELGKNDNTKSEAIALYKENKKLYSELEGEIDGIGSEISSSKIKDNSGNSVAKTVKVAEYYRLKTLRAIHQGIMNCDLCIKQLS